MVLFNQEFVDKRTNILSIIGTNVNVIVQLEFELTFYVHCLQK